ncbi:hypothetical protein [Flavobacterium silvaticum]|uniref:Uncharacterized protein n=1 Tax=Flavobacterium silvaticum TaxID=1852020 RepID=A0A972FJW4_9FLAO|nr:hypothetical protein [Flavobacterium silvaticum]NMH26560.1 hypothetical protein [Flavobacterium silvaticum]
MSNEPATKPAISPTQSELIESNLSKFLEEITALIDNLPFQLTMISIKHRNLLEKLEKISTQHIKTDDKGNESTIYRVVSEHADEFTKIHKLLRRLDIAKKILPRNYIVSIVSQYDAFLGELCRILFEINPNIIRSSEKTWNAEDIFNYKTLDELKEHMIDKEVDSLLREEHHEQLKILERKITKVANKEFTLTTDLAILPCFVELTQRRNLFVHTNGLITRQYLEAKSRWKFETECSGNLNEELKADQEYCEKSFRTLFEMAVKLTHVLWRKLVPTDREKADIHLNQTIYELLLDGKYELAIVISDFALNVIKRFSKEQFRKFIIINKAIAFKVLGKPDKCQNILNAEDWSIGNEFKLAKAILEDDYEEAKKMMLKIGSLDELVNKYAYKNWPLFKDFRKSKEFLDAYQTIYGEDFVFEEKQENARINDVDLELEN